MAKSRSPIIFSGRKRLLFICKDRLLTMGRCVAWSPFSSTHPAPGGFVLVNYSGTLSVPRLLHVIAFHLPATLYLLIYYLEYSYSRLVDLVASLLVLERAIYEGISYVAADGGGARLSHRIGLHHVT
jgi:hypothetical protein